MCTSPPSWLPEAGQRSLQAACSPCRRRCRQDTWSPSRLYRVTTARTAWSLWRPWTSRGPWSHLQMPDLPCRPSVPLWPRWDPRSRQPSEINLACRLCYGHCMLLWSNADASGALLMRKKRCIMLRSCCALQAVRPERMRISKYAVL